MVIIFRRQIYELFPRFKTETQKKRTLCTQKEKQKTLFRRPHATIRRFDDLFETHNDYGAKHTGSPATAQHPNPGQRRRTQTTAGLHPGRRPRFIGRRAGRRQNHAGARCGGGARPGLPPRAVHQRHAAFRPLGHQHLPPERRQIRIPPRPRVPLLPAGRRNQPRLAQTAIRPA